MNSLIEWLGLLAWIVTKEEERELFEQQDNKLKYKLYHMEKHKKAMVLYVSQVGKTRVSSESLTVFTQKEREEKKTPLDRVWIWTDVGR